MSDEAYMRWDREKLWEVAHHIGIGSDIGQRVNLALINSVGQDSLYLFASRDDHAFLKSVFRDCVDDHCLRTESRASLLRAARAKGAGR